MRKDNKTFDKKGSVVYEINFIKHFTEEERNKIEEYVKNNINDMDLSCGLNNLVDISDVINRTSNVDIYIY